MKRIEVKEGDRYGAITIVKVLEMRKSDRARKVMGRCDCGRKKRFYLHNLRSGMTTTCGCVNRVRAKDLNQHKTNVLNQKSLQELVGKMFGSLQVITAESATEIMCRCLCGHIKLVKRTFKQLGDSKNWWCRNCYDCNTVMIDDEKWDKHRNSFLGFVRSKGIQRVVDPDHNERWISEREKIRRKKDGHI